MHFSGAGGVCDIGFAYETYENILHFHKEIWYTTYYLFLHGPDSSWSFHFKQRVE